MRWIFSKKRVPQSDGRRGEPVVKEVQVLKAQEESGRVQVQLAEQALREFMQAVSKTYFGDTSSHKYGVVVVTAREHISELIKGLGRVEENLLNIRTYGRKIKKLAEQLEADLLDMRDTSSDKRVEHLSEDELRVLDYTKSVDSNIQGLVALVRSARKYEYGEILHQGGYDLAPKNRVLAAEVKASFERIQQGLSTLHKHLVEVYELEKKVEELTAAYINA